MVKPRIEHLPAKRGSAELGKRAVALSGESGLVLDDWQAYVLENSLRRHADKWAALEVGVNVPRQNGKGALLEARMLASAFITKAQLTLYTAHLYDTSMEAFRRFRDIIDENPKLRAQLRKEGRSTGVMRSHGEEGFEFRGDRRVRFRTRSKGGGRGFTADVVIFDEAMILPEHTLQAMQPVLSGRSLEGDPQLWYTGSAVDQEIHEHGIVFARMRERAMSGDPRLAWFEWSVEGDDPDLVLPEVLKDRAAWAAANPALGIRIDPDYVDNERRSLGVRAFAVERLGIGDWPRTDHVAANPVDFDDWLALGGDLVIKEPQVVAFDVSPERKGAVVIAGRTKEGFVQGELVESKGGTLWLPPEVARLAKAHKLKVFCDGRGPAASLIPELRDLDIDVEPLSSTDHAAACGNLLDGIQRQTVRHLNDPELNGAVHAAHTRPLGDAWAWSRKDSSTNIAPLVAFTIAVSAVMTQEKPRKVAVAFG